MGSSRGFQQYNFFHHEKVATSRRKVVISSLMTLADWHPKGPKRICVISLSKSTKGCSIWDSFKFPWQYRVTMSEFVGLSFPQWVLQRVGRGGWAGRVWGNWKLWEGPSNLPQGFFFVCFSTEHWAYNFNIEFCLHPQPSPIPASTFLLHLEIEFHLAYSIA